MHNLAYSSSRTPTSKKLDYLYEITGIYQLNANVVILHYVLYVFLSSHSSVCFIVHYRVSNVCLHRLHLSGST